MGGEKKDGMQFVLFGHDMRNEWFFFLFIQAI